MNPELIENCLKMKPRGAKWTKKQTSGAKWTKNGAKSNTNSKQIAQDGPRQRRRAAREAQTGLWRNSGPPKWKPKSTKIDEKSIQKSIIFLITFRIDFSSIFDRKIVEKCCKINQKMMKKTSRRKMLKKRKTYKNLKFLKVF